MDKKLKQFINKTKDIRLEDSEKEHLRTNILNFVKENPVRKPADERLILQRTIFPFNLNLKTMPIIPAILALSLLTGGASLAAEQSLPGDFLYPMKVSVTEELRAVVSIGPASDAKWEIKRIERRLEEAEKLASRNMLPTMLASEIEQNIEEHAEEIKFKIAKLENNHIASLEINSRLESVLSFHEEVLNGFAEDVEGITILLPRVVQERDSARTIMVDIDDNISKREILITQKNAQEILNAVKRDISKVRELIAEHVAKADRESNEEKVANAQKYLIEAERLYEQGLRAFNLKDYSNSFLTLNKAQQALKNAKSLLDLPVDIILPPIDIDLPMKPDMPGNSDFKPLNLDYEIQEGGVLIKWDSPKKEVAEYRIAISGFGGFIWKDVADTSGTNYFLRISPDACFLKIRITPIDKNGELLTYSPAHLNNIDFSSYYSGDDCGPVDPPAPFFMGDINSDGTITSLDALMVLSHVDGKTSLSHDQVLRADVDQDDKITRADSEAILAFVVNKLKELPIRFGDVNGDRVITIVDAQRIASYIAGGTTLTSHQLFVADVDRDGRVTSADVDSIAAFVVGNINSLPVFFGDVNGDRVITAVDAQRVASYIVGGTTFTSHQLFVADVDRDGEITKEDSQHILGFIVGTIDNLPVLTK